MLETFVECVEDLFLVTCARGDREIDVEHATDDGRRAEYPACAWGKAFETSIHQAGERGRQIAVAIGANDPARVLVTNQTVVEKHANELGREQRIAFRVLLNEGYELATRVAAEDAAQPLLELRAGEARQNH